MAATLKDIADYVGTSTTTVSKVLSNKEIRVSAEKRQEILEAAEKLKYLPNASGVNLKKGSTDMIAVIVGDLLYSYYAKLLKQISHLVSAQGKSMIVCDIDNDFQTEREHYQRLKTGYVDGAIIVPAPTTVTASNIAASLDILKKIDLPIVFVCDSYGGAYGDWSTVGTNAFESGYMAAKHLIGLGHRKIGYISESLGTGNLNPKLMGFQTALKESGLEAEEDWILYGYTRYRGGRDAYIQLADKDITAVVCSNDSLAIGFSVAAIADNKRVPQDYSVVGMDDIMATRHCNPQMTTVSQDTEEIARAAVNKLFSDIRSHKSNVPKEICHVNIPQTLVVRGSTSALDPGEES